ncbi:hypothetical protein K439DRAFT_1637637 [Ramaria rubella]|nr:hypothetical protein K439DRAFT_1643254 [Ramaria rubella]KAF8579743.1 hypothetical protein K439DRAFT_1637637 [Ramaria rubella]
MTIKRRRWLAGHALLRYAPSFDPRGARFRCDELDVQHVYRGYAIKAAVRPDMRYVFLRRRQDLR